MTDFALVVVGNGRLQYLEHVVDAALQHLPTPSHLLMVDDSGDPVVRRELKRQYPDFTIFAHDHNFGMAAAVQSGFHLVRATDAEYVFWLEEDMQLITSPPIDEAAQALTVFPTLAQICFRREPWWGSPVEIELGDQLAAICKQADQVVYLDSVPVTTHDFIFSLNPCLIPRTIIDTYDWPSGPIGVGNETGMTNQLRADGWWFGSWGAPGDGQCWARHLGEQRSRAWQL